jgi:hypothetical protein
MSIVLTQEDITTINGLIQKMPFEHAMPLFQLFTKKIQEAQEAAKETEEKPKAKK